jgi:hypothetical protein
MEIKKYVLLDDKRIDEIYGKTKFGYEYVDSKTESGIVITRTLLEDRIVKTSNNILDLVEVGDLVEASTLNIYNIYQFEKYDGLKVYAKYLNNGYGVLSSKITSIYKKQPNGDYKRYEVKD